VVTQDVPAGEVWVGNPAKKLRKVDGASGIGDDQSRVEVRW
jgi:acetyltransferase-like isoleucine patch superfamily enzyme